MRRDDAAGSATPCPLCGRAAGNGEIARIPYRAIWEALASEWEVRPAATVVEANTPAEAAVLRECAGCGLQYFSPACGGDGAFYDALAGSPRYYSSWKWEFGWVRERLPSGAEVLDVGCGGGDFLAAVAPRVRRAVGLEQSPVASAAARARGLEVAEQGAGEYARRHRREFDAVCLFHVLEHLDDVGPFVRALASCLRPGGSLFISLPNRERSFRRPLEPLDCPPHHLSRWSARQLERLAAECALRLAELAPEPVDVTMLRGEALRRLRERLERLAGPGPALGRWSARLLAHTLLHPALCRLYAATRFFDRVGMRGMSLAARCVLEGEAA